MRIAVIGPVGLPPAGGGVTRHSRELYTRLAALGHDVTIFGRAGYMDRDVVHEGVVVRRVGVLPLGGWETLGYGLSCTLRCLREPYDLIHYQGVAAATFASLARRRGRRVALTVHSVDWQHAKWGRGARGLLRRSEAAAVRSAHVVIAVSRTLHDHLVERYPGVRVHHIPNGLTPLPASRPSILDELAVAAPYLLFVGRLVPEKGLLALLEAHSSLPGSRPPLLVVGDARAGSSYVRELRVRAGPDVRFLGAQTAEAVSTLMDNAVLFVAPSQQEGFSLTVLEACSVGCPVLSSDIPAHLEIVGEDGIVFRSGSVSSLTRALRDALASPDELAKTGSQLRDRVMSSGLYDWDRIAERTHELITPLGR